MQSFTMRCAPFLMALASAATALDGITVPSSVAADQPFKITFEGAGEDHYRVYLAAAVVTGARGPSCYLKNDTDLMSPLELTIPADVGPSADYYSIAIADVTTGQGAAYSPTFNLTGGNGKASDYEVHLGGAPFWDANSLPCSAMSCVRDCAQAGYPEDLTKDSAYDTMKTCILACPGVSPDDSQTAPVHSDEKSSSSVDGAVLSLGPSMVVTAQETTVTSGSKTLTEAVIGGSRTLTLGDAAITMSTHTISLASDGVDVDSKTTVAFSAQTASATGSGAAAATTGASSSAQSGSGASRRELGALGALVAGLAAVML